MVGERYHQVRLLQVREDRIELIPSDHQVAVVLISPSEQCRVEPCDMHIPPVDGESLAPPGWIVEPRQTQPIEEREIGVVAGDQHGSLLRIMKYIMDEFLRVI